MDIWRTDGFEHGNATSGATGLYTTIQGTPAISTTTFRSGLRALEIDTTAAAERVGVDLPVGGFTAWQSFYIRFPTLPTAVVIVANFGNASGAALFQYDNGTGRFAISNNNVNRTSIGPTVATNTWYQVDLSCDSSTGSTFMRGQIDAGPIITVQRVQATSTLTQASIGTTQADTLHAFYDDWDIGADLADFPRGGHHVESLIPSADGTHAVGSGAFDSFTGTAFNNATTNGNTFIGHRPLQLANTANQVIRQVSNDVTGYMEFTLEDLASGTGVVEGVRAYAVAQEAGTGNSVGSVKLLLSTNVEVLTDGSLSVIDSTETITDAALQVYKRQTIPPSGGWDRTKVNGLKVRVGFADGAPDVNFIDFMLSVSLTDITLATPAKVSAVAAVATPTIPLGAGPVPDGIHALASIPTPTIRRTATATPSKISGIAAVPTPTVLAGAATNVFPVKISAVAVVRTPHITTGAASADTYSAGYGQGYETITEVVVVPPEVPTRAAATPGLRVRVDWEHDLNPLDGRMPEPRWTDISAMTKAPEGMTMKRGRQRELDRNEAGQMTVTVADMDRLLDPDNFESPFYPGVSPDRRIRLESVTPWVTGAFTMASSQVGGDDLVGGGETFHYNPIFDGVIDSFEYAYPGPGKYAVVTMRCSDLLALFSRDSLGMFSTNVYVEDHMNAILNYRSYTGRADGAVAGDPAGSDLRDIPPRDTDIVVEVINVANTSILAMMELLAVTGGGNFFIAKDGRPTYRNRGWLERPAADGRRWAVDGERFHDVAFKVDETLIYNDITVSNSIDTIHGVAEDSASQARHPGRPPLVIQTLLTTQIDLTARAEELLANYHEATKVVTMLDLSNVVTDWELVLGLELWDRITLEVVLPNGDLIVQDSLVEGIELTTSNHFDWRPILWVSVPPFRNLLDIANSSFEELGVPTVGDWTAESNCVVTSETLKLNLQRYHHGDTIVAGTAPINPPRGLAALRLNPVADGDFSAVSGTIPVEARQTYLARTSDNVTMIDAALNYDLNASQAAHLELDWYDSALGFLSTDIGDEATVYTRRVGSLASLSQPPGPNNHPEWVRLQVQTRSPSGAAFVRIRVATNGIQYQAHLIDDVLLSRVV